MLRKIIIVCAAFVLSYCCPNLYADTSAGIKATSSQIRQLIEQKNLTSADAAVAQMKSDYASDPKLPDALVNIAIGYRLAKQNLPAHNLFAYVSDSFPGSQAADNARLQMSLLDIEALFAKGDLTVADAAVAKMRADFISNPMFAGVLYTTASCYIRSNQPQKLIEIYNAVIAASPDSRHAANARLELAVLNIKKLVDSNDMVSADAAIAKMQADFATHPKLPAKLSETAMKLESRDVKRAKNIFNTIIQNWPDDPAAAEASIDLEKFRLKGLIKAKSPDFAAIIGAIDTLQNDFNGHQRLFNIAFDTAEKLYLRGEAVSSAAGEPNKAYFQTSLQILQKYAMPNASANSFKADTLHIIGLNNMMLRYYLKAATAFEEAHQIDPKEGGYARAVAACYEKLRDAGDVNSVKADAAIERSYLSIFKDDPNDTDLALRLGRINMEKGKWQDAIFYFEKALEKFPADNKPTNILYALARMYEKTDNKPKALDMYRQLLLLLDAESPEIQKVQTRIALID